MSEHITRYSDSSLYDEVCVLCGAHDGYNGELNLPCPVLRREADKCELMVFRAWNDKYGDFCIAPQSFMVVSKLHCSQLLHGGTYYVSEATLKRMKEDMQR